MVERTVVERTVVETTSGGKHTSPCSCLPSSAQRLFKGIELYQVVRTPGDARESLPAQVKLM